jgi:ankyrin repeat protein
MSNLKMHCDKIRDASINKHANDPLRISLKFDTYKYIMQTSLATLAQQVNSKDTFALHMASINCFPRNCIRKLCKAGCDVNTIDGDGCTAIILAIFNGNAAVVDELALHQADLSCRNNGHNVFSLTNFAAANVTNERRVEVRCILASHGVVGNRIIPAGFTSKLKSTQMDLTRRNDGDTPALHSCN